jgi:hypothetical protein
MMSVISSSCNQVAKLRRHDHEISAGQAANPATHVQNVDSAMTEFSETGQNTKYRKQPHAK